MSDTFLDLTMHGNVSEILRQIAKRIDAGEVTIDQVTAKLQGDHVELHFTLDVTGQKHDTGVRPRGR